MKFSKTSLLIDSLPFTSEGYTVTKNILMNKCGKPSAVSNAQVQNIVSLSHINNANPKKSSQVLEKITM